MSATESTATFDELIMRLDPVVRELATTARALITRVMPAVVEVVWLRQGIAGYGTGPKKMSEQFCYIAPYGKHVNLGFYYGAELPDPTGLLTGAGKTEMRHIKITSVEQLRQPAVRALIDAASTHRVPPLKTTG